MVKYVGVKTVEEAMCINNEFLDNAKKHNKSVKAQRNMSSFMTFCIAAFVVIIAKSLLEYYEAPVNVAQNTMAVVYTLAIFATVIVFTSYYSEIQDTYDWNKPFTYQFFKATNKMAVLKSETRFGNRLGHCDLWLTLRNNNNEVSTEIIRNFKEITRTDIKDTIVNLDEGIIYLPYKNY